GVVAEDPMLPRRIRAYADGCPDLVELMGEPLVIRGGEICKLEPIEVEQIYGLVEQHRICRHSFLMVVGGGSVIDAVGFAAATAHRGIRLIRLPTTVLGQNDAGIGVKNAVNFRGRKNFVGTFAPPFAVINDTAFLRCLPTRELRSGLAEAVKVALIRDRDFFHYLVEQRSQLAGFERRVLEQVIYRCAELHLNHIGSCGDPFELGTARPLDFGHWSAHKLEELSDGGLRHGEAVAIGIALDSLYSERRGWLAPEELASILDLLEGIGFELYHDAAGRLDVAAALEEFREHIGGELTITLLKGLGQGFECREIDAPLMESCLEHLSHRNAKPRETLYA
ncbi:MAG: 3-dehydroquinate synthase, partial [Holophagales bacterium]|nr:3-dehydroquinate synthase [Holophagales bacterium]